MTNPTTSSVPTTSSAQNTSLRAGEVPSYANEHDPSWEEVISMVVIPGQPDQIRDAAGNWEVLFSRIDQARAAIDQLSSGLQTWEGAAGEAYRRHLGELSGRVSETIEGNRGVVQQLHTAADHVDNALHNTPIPDELVDEVMQARQKFQQTGQLDTKFHPGWFGDLLFPGFLNLAGDIFGFLTFGLSDKASDMLRDFLSDGDDKAKAAYQALSGQHTSTASAMPPAAGFLMDSLNPTTEWGGATPGGTGAPGSGPGTGTMGNLGPGGGGPGVDPDEWAHQFGSGLAGAGGAGPVSVPTPSTGPGSLHPIGGTGSAGAGGLGGLGAGGAGGAGGLRPGGVTSAASAIKGGMGGMPGMGGMAGAGAGGARAGGVGGAGGAKPGGVPSARAGGMGGMPMGGMGGAHGGAAGARGGGGRTAVPGVGSAVAGGAGRGGAGGGAGGAGRGMAGMPMGGHGGGSGEGADHSTWLEEDEDVWGTDSDAAPPVLG